MSSSSTSLPVHAIGQALLSALRDSGRAVLSAPTGSGKTTQVPQMLWQAGMIRGSIIILQPRRLAARWMAQRVASEMQCKLGELVGYQVRHDSCVSSETRIVFMTEGLFLRMMQDNAQLAGVGAVVLDEFHERNIAGDTALALVARLQSAGRPDLKLLVMSATLETESLCRYLNAPLIEAKTRAFPVDTHYLATRTQKPVWQLAADALDEVLRTTEQGDVLIFMPGGYEIRRTIDACASVAGPDVELRALHGQLPPHEQDKVLAPIDKRKVIVATNVAETSITIEGVHYVIDSGLVRMQRHDPRRGINVLLIEPINQASAQQRAGRAGRTGPGTCFRLWTQQEHRARPMGTDAEIHRVDLSPLLLDVEAMGVAVDQLHWLDAPRKDALERARQLLRELGATDADDRPTKTGRLMARLPVHPRLSRMLIEASQQHCLERMCLWAAMISERDMLMPRGWSRFAQELTGEARSDFQVLELAFDHAQRVRFDVARCESAGVVASAARQVALARDQLVRTCTQAGLSKSKAHADDLSAAARSLLVGFADHLAARRSADNPACALVHQRRGELDRNSVATQGRLLLPIDIQELGAGSGVRTVLSLVTEMDPQWLTQMLPQRVTTPVVHQWDAQHKRVVRVEQMQFDDLVFDEQVRGDPDPMAAGDILAKMVLAKELKLERWDEKVEQWIARTRCAAQWFGEQNLLTYDQQDIAVIVHEICSGAVRYSQIKDADCLTPVRGALSWDQQQFVERMTPEKVTLPRGFSMKLTYQAGHAPRGRAKIQDLYGLTQTPRVAGGRQSVLLEILGPNFRPVQVTEDLSNFWKELYPTLRKELARRYPRHEWRENPL